MNITDYILWIISAIGVALVAYAVGWTRGWYGAWDRATGRKSAIGITKTTPPPSPYKSKNMTTKISPKQTPQQCDWYVSRNCTCCNNKVTTFVCVLSIKGNTGCKHFKSREDNYITEKK